MAVNKAEILKYMIENEHFIISPLLSTDQFVSYCKDRDIQASREQLEQFEKLGLFYPIARVQYPKIKIKIEYLDKGRSYRDLGVLRQREKWSGDLKEEYEHFSFKKEHAKSWFEEGLLWEPSSRPFQEWKTFSDDDGGREIESFYSIFQCYTLHNLIQSTGMEISAAWWVSHREEDIGKLINQISGWSKNTISSLKQNGIRGDKAIVVCQIISNRYFPKTQSDRRAIQISRPSHYYDWDWRKYCRNWNAKAVLSGLDISTDEVRQLQQLVAVDANSTDPLESWYELVGFVSLDERKRLKGNALLAQTLYSMEHMLRLFYEELTGNKLRPPDELLDSGKDWFYGEGVTQNELQYLEFLTNQYHLNPRPKLILVVEGDGEAEQFPRLAKEMLGYSFPKVGIQIINLEGVGNFTGRKRIDKYGALERFIDDYHNRQTIVLVVLDNEGRVLQVKKRLLKTRSKYYKNRKVTKEEYIHVWKRNIEFDNFSPDEITQAMTELSEGCYTFQAKDVADGKKSLSELYKEKVACDLSKTKLLNILCGHIIANRDKEFDSNGNPKRPLVQVLQKAIRLAARNHQSVKRDTWVKNQESGHFGDLS